MEKEKPTVASFCTTFLKPEMRHIYRQVTGLQRYRTFIIANERFNPSAFPFAPIELVHPTPTPLLRRGYLKYILRVPPLYYRGELEALLKILHRRPAALLHVYFGHTGVHLSPFITYWKRPTIVSFHGADVMPRHQHHGYLHQMKKLFTLVPLVLARSQSLARQLQALGCPAEKIRLNRTGIPLESFPFIPRATPTDGAWRLVQSCRFIEKKGIPTALRAFATFRRTYPKATFTLAGDGPMRGELQTFAAQLGLGSAVRFTGFLNQSELNTLYATAHLFLHPSQITAGKDQEGIPNSMLEAMATGLPVAATLHGGIPEAVQNEKTGLLVPEHAPEALATALLRLAQYPQETLEMGTLAAQSVREEFSQHRAIAQLEAAYDEARQRGKPPGFPYFPPKSHPKTQEKAKKRSDFKETPAMP